MIPSSRGLSRFNSQQSGQSKINSVGERFPINKSLMEVIKGLEGASTESAQIQELQWDALGSTVLHVDLTRMDANAMIEGELTISLTGDADVSINQVIRTTTAVVPAMNIPNGLVADISSLNDGDSISLGDIELPEKVSLLSDPSTVVVTCGAVAAPETPAEEATVADDAEDAEDAGSNETEESGGDE